MSKTVTVAIPDGEVCVKDDGKRCIFARYTKKWDAYNCALHHRILKGGNFPRKCRECSEAEAPEQPRTCEWCMPDENGEYAMCGFSNPSNDQQSAMLSFYGGQVITELRIGAAEKAQRLAAPINYCPMCGRKVAEDDYSGGNHDE